MERDKSINRFGTLGKSTALSVIGLSIATMLHAGEISKKPERKIPRAPTGQEIVEEIREKIIFHTDDNNLDPKKTKQICDSLNGFMEYTKKDVEIRGTRKGIVCLYYQDKQK